jgi:hypothetical protein
MNGFTPVIIWVWNRKRSLDSKYRCHARKGNFYNFGPALHDHFIAGCTEFMQVNSRQIKFI